MTKTQIDQYDMLLSVENHFDDNVSIWNDTLPVKTAKTEFSALLNALAAQVAIQLENPTGATEEKAAARALLESLAFKMSAAIRGYAANADLKDLYKRVDFSKSDLSKFRDAELVGVVTNLGADAASVEGELEDFGIDATKISALEMAKTNFAALMKNPTEAIARRKAATDSIAKLLPPMMEFLSKRMDNVMVALSDTEQEFADIYTNVRVLNDTGVNPLSLTITTLDAATQLPIPNANLEILGEGITRTSSARGYNTVQNLAAGPHDVLATHPNYTSQTVHFTVVSGETTELVVQMVRV